MRDVVQLILYNEFIYIYVTDGVFCAKLYRMILHGICLLLNTLMLIFCITTGTSELLLITSLDY